MMTPEEVNKIFPVKNSTEIPTYDIVPVLITKPENKSINSYLFQTPFGKHKHMWLNPLDGILASENITISSLKYNSSTDGLNITDWPNLVESIIPNIYENTLHATTVAVNSDANGLLSMTGYIGNKFIHPVPPRLIRHARRRRSINFKTDSDDQVDHIIYTIPDQLNKHLPPIEAFTLKRYRSKRSIPEIIYPEILVIVDHGLNERIGGSIRDKLLYLLAFWNGVDMRYRSLENPRIRLNIARILLAEDRLPYVTVNLKSNYFLMNHVTSLRAQGNWLFKMNETIPLDSYDLAVTMIPNLFCEDKIGPNCTIVGQAFLHGACKTLFLNKTTNKASFIRDVGGFDGIQTAAHELGHLFGMFHDGLYGCNDSHGYIMAPSDKFTPQSFDWSNCSLNQMDKYLKDGLGSCLFNPPLYQSKPFLRYLPGKLMNATQQCSMFVNGSATVEDDTICTQLKCSKKGKIRLPEAAEGTPCGIGKLCLHGLCTEESSIV
ncbi:venom metalloproteinase 3-like [Cotesia glomerata]|nr:venom metalloproteinase 3-like [Cotesia glomerata]